MHYSLSQYILLIICMALITYLPRFLPLFLLTKHKLPALFESWLSYVPVAVLSALLGPALFMPGAKLTLQPALNPFFWAAIPSFVIAILTRNMFLTVLIGMGSVAALRYFL